MDEVDGISGRHDRGGLTELLKIIKNSAYPIICTANDPESDKLDRLKKILRVFEYQRLDEFQIFELLLSISERENIEVNEIALEEIAAKAAGDIRAAINELESHIYGTDAVQLEERNKMITLTELFNELYRSKNYEEARKVMNNAPSDYYKLLLFLYDNTADQCKNPREVASAYEQIAQADLVYNRIMRTQDWSLLKYFFSFIGPGLALARPSNFSKKITNLPDIPSSFMSRGIAKRVKSKALKLAPSVAPHLHISETRFVNQEFDLFSKIILGRTDSWAKRGAEVAAWLGLEDEHLDELIKINPNSPVLDYIDDARRVVGREHLKQAIGIPEETPFALDGFISNRIKSNTHESVREESDDFEEEEDHRPDSMSLDDFF
jgi:replication factor C large subunit